VVLAAENRKKPNEIQRYLTTNQQISCYPVAPGLLPACLFVAHWMQIPCWLLAGFLLKNPIF